MAVLIRINRINDTRRNEGYRYIVDIRAEFFSQIKNK